MKKLLIILMALLMTLSSVSAFAVSYSDLEVLASVEFEGITDADLGGSSEIIGDFDPHGDWGYTEGFASIVEGKNGNGLQFTPNYENEVGYLSCVMRAKMPIIAQQIEGWQNAWGLRFYIANNTFSDAYVTPLAIVYDDTGRTVYAPGLGAYTVEDGEYYEAELHSQVDTTQCSMLIPSGFEGYVVLPFAVMGGDIDEYECGWQIVTGWTGSSQEVDMSMVTNFQMDVRVAGFDPGDTEGIVFDSFEFVGHAGDEVDPPEGGEATEPDDDNKEPQQTEQAGDTTTEPDVTDDSNVQPEGNGNLVIIIAGVAAAVVVVVVVVIIISKKKKAE